MKYFRDKIRINMIDAISNQTTRKVKRLVFHQNDAARLRGRLNESIVRPIVSLFYGTFRKN
jgi:ribosomal protein S20